MHSATDSDEIYSGISSDAACRRYRAGGSYFRMVRPKCFVERTRYVGGSGDMPPPGFKKKLLQEIDSGGFWELITLEYEV